MMIVGIIKKKSFDKQKIQNRDNFFWPLCGKSTHLITKMAISQIIPGSCLYDLHEKLHEVLANFHIEQNTACKFNYIYQTSLSSPSSLSLSIKKQDILYLKYPCSILDNKKFENDWKQGKPIVVTNMSDCLNLDLWCPKEFCRQFEKEKINVIDCVNNTIVQNVATKTFWRSFENNNERIKDKNGQPKVLKLKDWPDNKNFADALPTHFEDFMKCLPFDKYTRYDGKFNLVTRLQKIPDMGPKMYAAHALPANLKETTTKLHLDMADAVNVAVYASKVDDNPNFSKGLCGKNSPVAEWHIFSPSDTEKIRNFLNKIGEEQNQTFLPNHDPIHDQQYHFDEKLLQRLYNDYNVQPYSFTQLLGDAIFIPAGAAHQVRNLSNSVKIAVDFVSPHNVNKCVKLTNEFRKLYHTHSNHPDKLQIKNIIYHSVKDAVSALTTKVQGIANQLGKEMFFKNLNMHYNEQDREQDTQKINLLNRFVKQEKTNLLCTRRSQRQEKINFNKKYEAFEDQLKSLKKYHKT